ncbi:MAG: stage II sporulation protein M, partial [Bacteroidales bacterium]|nr:stage II sporulation protein M [Bacteroidales bacterium]
TILGDRYVNMTLENIHNDDPMAVYKESGQGIMFLQITYNNILVSLRTFIFGLFFGIGSLLSMLHNGIMVGTFQYFFVEKGLFRESALTIWQHGTLEIASIIIAGGAGLVLGKGLIFPGTYTRFQALRISARRGIKIMIGIIPIFILAAFIESYFTRHTDIGDFFRVLSILLSLTFVVGYFVIYPWMVSRRYAELIDISETLNENLEQRPNYKILHTTDQIFGLSFALFRKYFKQVMVGVILIACITGVFVSVLSERILSVNEVFVYGINTYKMLFLYNEYPLMFFVNTVVIGLILLSSVFVVYVNYHGLTYNLKSFIKYFARQIINTLIISGLINFLFFISIGWAILILFFIMPAVYLTLSVDVFQRKFSLAAIPSALSLMKYNMQNIIVNYLKFSCILVVMVVLANPAYYNRFIEAVNWSLYLPEHLSVYLLNFLLLFIIYFAIALWTVLTGISFSIHYFTMAESHSAKNLLERVNQISRNR